MTPTKRTTLDRRYTPPGKGIGAEALAKLVETRTCLTLDDLVRHIERPRKHITSAICHLITDRYVVRRERGCYEVTAAGVKAHKKGYTCGPRRQRTSLPKPRSNTIRQRCWTLLRMRRRQSTYDLVASARSERDRAPQKSVLKFMRSLERAGYVARLDARAPGTAPTSNGYVNWLLVRDTGPVAPIFNHIAGTVRDGNTGETIALKAVRS